MQIDVYIHVQGTPTHQDDEGLPGVYLVEVQAPSITSLEGLQEAHRGKVAAAALDEFHHHQGIEELDPFTITAYAADGSRLDEPEGAIDETGLVGSCAFVGDVPHDQLPAAVLQVVSPKPSRRAPR